MQIPPNPYPQYPQQQSPMSIPLKEQLVIDELVEFWQTHGEPRDLTAHIRGTLKPDYTILTWFFVLVRDNLRNDKHSEYAASSASEFRQFLEAECRRLYLPYAERQAEAQAKAEAERLAKMKAEIERQAQIREEAERLAKMKAENERRVRAEIDALGMLMVKTPDPNKRRELGRKRLALTQSIGIRLDGEYRNHCWSCKMLISSEINVRCPSCTLFICNYCGACFCTKTNNPLYYQADDPFLPDYPDDLS